MRYKSLALNHNQVVAEFGKTPKFLHLPMVRTFESKFRRWKVLYLVTPRKWKYPRYLSETTLHNVATTKHHEGAAYCSMQKDILLRSLRKKNEESMGTHSRVPVWEVLAETHCQQENPLGRTAEDGSLPLYSLGNPRQASGQVLDASQTPIRVNQYKLQIDWVHLHSNPLRMPFRHRNPARTKRQNRLHV